LGLLDWPKPKPKLSRLAITQGVPAAGYGIFLQFFGRLLSNFVNSCTSSSGFNKSFCAAATIRCTFHALFASGSWAITIKWKLVHSTLEGSIECQHLPQGTSQIEKKNCANKTAGKYLK